MESAVPPRVFGLRPSRFYCGLALAQVLIVAAAIVGYYVFGWPPLNKGGWGACPFLVLMALGYAVQGWGYAKQGH